MIYTSPANWSNAPEWANWFAVDINDGLAFWFEEHPSLQGGETWYAYDGLRAMVGHVSPPVLILEARPESERQDKFDKFLDDLSDLIAAYQD